MYPENNPTVVDPPFPITHYPTPGLTLFGQPSAPGVGRGLYYATNGVVYAVVGSYLYSVDPVGNMVQVGLLEALYPPLQIEASWAIHSTTITLTSTPVVIIGTEQIVAGMVVTGAGIPVKTVVTSFDGTVTVVISNQTTTTVLSSAPELLTFTLPDIPSVLIDDRSTPVSMIDNNTQMVIVNGSTAGWYIILALPGFTGPPPSLFTLYDPSFLGADRVDFVDTFFIFNEPNTPAWYSSLSESILFDPLYFASKSGSGDYLVTVIVCKRWIWLMGQRTTEIWYNAGTPDFPFAIMPGQFIEHGIMAKYSIAKMDDSVYWLSGDKDGHGIVLRGVTGGVGVRISTFAIEAAFQHYGVISDAVGFTYVQNGHSFYCLSFPTADKTWVYDISTQQWHEWSWMDAQGVEHRARPMAAVGAYGKNLALDWENGNVYILDPDNQTDNGSPVVRRRGWPHLVSDGKRVTVWEFMSDMQVGNSPAPNVTPQVSLRCSVDRGASWSETMIYTLGATGEYGTQVFFPRLGQARDWVFEIFWSSPTIAALNGAWIETEVSRS